MRVLCAASEVYPFAKTGGLADVLGALPRALSARGHEVAACMPLYRQVRESALDLTLVKERISCPFARGNRPFNLLEGRLPGSDVRIWFVENPGIFEAESSLYGTAPGAFGDGHLRFLYFSRTVLRIPAATGFHPDIFHLHDWPTALVPALARTVYRDDPIISNAAFVLTIHNLAYQGIFATDELVRAGIPSFLINEGRLLERGRANLLAGGIRFADAINTVSEGYAREILTPEFAAGLDPVLDWRKDLLTGILNGLDTDAWDPANDPHLAAAYTATDLRGKAECKRFLLEELSLPPTDGPVLAVIARFVDQKGLELLTPILPKLFKARPEVRMVALGSGDSELEEAFSELGRNHPEHMVTRLGFDAPLSHRIEAGADIFVMPSIFEPCGLNQLISMRYGTVPVVRAVGGLADTVTAATKKTMLQKTATGFVFQRATSAALNAALKKALDLYYDDPAAFDALRVTGMSTDWSWDKASAHYVTLFERAREQAANGEHLAPILAGLPPDPIEVELPPLEDVPDHYARDLLVAISRDPTTLYVRWSLTGDLTQDWIESLDPKIRPGTSFRLLVEAVNGAEQTTHEIARFGERWLKDLTPGNTYRASLLGCPTVDDAHPLLESAVATLPPNQWPES